MNEFDCGHALCLQGCTHPLHQSERERERGGECDKEGVRERKRGRVSERGRESDKEGVRERKRERERERERVIKSE
jgi:hypothetical protein